MKFSYRVGQEDGKWVADCVEVEAAGEGKTAAEAVMTLRDVLTERFSPEAVAPPSGRKVEVEIELTLAAPTLGDAPKLPRPGVSSGPVTKRSGPSVSH